MNSEIDKWRAELKKKGWTELRHDIWKAPNGQLFRGPFDAWQRMKLAEEAR